MPRPKMTVAEWDQLEARAESSFNDGPIWKLFLMGNDRKRLKELYMAGDWLWMKLKEQGASEQMAEKICSIHGRKCFGKSDFWQVAQDCLDRWKDM